MSLKLLAVVIFDSMLVLQMTLLPVVDPGLMNKVQLLPWNLRSLTVGSSVLFISSFVSLPWVLFFVSTLFLSYHFIYHHFP